MNNLNRRAVLCNQLDMNFKEASELFEEESLESMQMARVNGGIVVSGTVVAIATIISAVVGVIACTYTILSEKDVNENEPTPGISSMDAISKMAEEIAKSGKDGEIICDSIIGNKIYGLKFTVSVPTPAKPIQ